MGFLQTRYIAPGQLSDLVYIKNLDGHELDDITGTIVDRKLVAWYGARVLLYKCQDGHHA